MDDDVELRRLRARVYGVGGEDASPETIARLAELEDAARASASVPPPGAPPPPPGDDPPSPAGPAGSAAVGASAPDDPRDPGTPPASGVSDAASARRRPAGTVIGAASAAVLLLGLGFAAGTVSSSLPSATPTPTAAPQLPELAFPQTDDDVVSAGLIADSGIDPATLRYIAEVRGFRVFLAERDQDEGACIVTVTASDGTPWSAGCRTDGPLGGGAIFGVDETLSIAIGDVAAMSTRGTPVRLSETVTAYLLG